MFDKVVIHKTSAKQLANFIQTPSHGLLISGPAGIGKNFLSQFIAQQLLGLDSLNNYPYLKIVATKGDNKDIGIDQIRAIEQFLYLKVPNNKVINRIVIIENSHLLSTEAQNAFLKTLEEPPAGTVMILTASRGGDLLPTILSRLQIIKIIPPLNQQLIDFFKVNYSENAINQALNYSGGLPGLMKALLDQDEHPLIAIVDLSKKILAASQYERLLIVETLSKQRQTSIELCMMLEYMASLSISRSKNQEAIRAWHRILKASYTSEQALTNNANIKLALTNLMLSMS